MATGDINLYDIPVDALKLVTVSTLSALLNPPKVIPTDDGLHRDWRGLASLTNLQSSSVSSKPSPTAEILRLWKDSSLGLLQDYLGQLDRWDVFDDTKDLMQQDAVAYLQSLARAGTSAPEVDAAADEEVLTADDVVRLRQGLPTQHYNAYLLYADEDCDFATKIIDTMENKYKLKLCVRDRDIVSGHAFEHEVILKLISERCNRLIVVVSPNFLKSEANKFFVKFAQALGIDKKRRKVIPVLFKQCAVPLELSYYFLLDYTRSGQLWDFWKKLKDSIESPRDGESVGTAEITTKCLSKKVEKEVEKLPAPSVPASSAQGSVPKQSWGKELNAHTSQKTAEVKKTKTLSFEGFLTKPRKFFNGYLTDGRKKNKNKSKKEEALLGC